MDLIEKNILTVRELAQRIPFKASTIYFWAETKIIPCIKIGKKTFFDFADVMIWLETHKQKPRL